MQRRLRKWALTSLAALLTAAATTAAALPQPAAATTATINGSTTYQPIDGVPNSLWAEKLDVVNILKGDVLVGVQGGFLITDPLPIHSFDDKAQLTDLAQVAIKRV